MIKGDEKADEKDRSNVELETRISYGFLTETRISHQPNTPKHFLDRSRHISFWIFLLCCSQSNDLTSRVCKGGNDQDAAKSIPSMILRSRYIPVVGTDGLPVKTKSRVAK